MATKLMLKRLEYREDPGLRRDCNMKGIKYDAARRFKLFVMGTD